MQACINQSTIMQCDTAEFIKMCSRAGFRQVELRFPKVEEYLTDHSCRILRALLRKHGVHLAALNSLEFFSLVPEQNFDFMAKKAEEMMVICQLIECDSLIVVPSKNPHNLPVSDIKKKTIPRLQRLADLGSRYGVRLSFEPIGFHVFSIRKVLDALDIVKQISKHKVGLTVDTFHFYIAENILGDLNEIPEDKISLIHFHDSLDLPLHKLNDEHRLFPGEGVVDLNGFCGILREKGYHGLLSVELFNPKLRDIAPRELARRAWESLQQYL